MPGIWQNFRIFRCVLLIELQAKLQLMHRFIYGADRFPMSAEIVRGMLQMILLRDAVKPTPRGSVGAAPELRLRLLDSVLRPAQAPRWRMPHLAPPPSKN